MRIAVVLGAMAVLAGCETGPPLSPAQCQVADWRALGFQDGAEGRAPERFVAMQQACAAAGLGADQTAYLAGRQDGLLTYCTPARAFQVGLSGASYAGVCPPEFDGAFRFAFSDGKRAYDVRQQVQSAESRISSLRSEREELEHKLDANERGLVESKTDTERARHKGEIDRLRHDIHETEERLRDAERDRRDQTHQLEDLRLQIGLQYGPW